MNKLQTLYNILQINRKIPSQKVRLVYLKDHWGIDQTVIGECEGISQSLVSKELIAAKKDGTDRLVKQYIPNLVTPDEVKYIQFLPREILTDMECIAFITKILDIEPMHPFFDNLTGEDSFRICALHHLGCQNKFLMHKFNKLQPTISMMVKRKMEYALKFERTNRYLDTANYTFRTQPQPNTKFFLAGGQ